MEGYVVLYKKLLPLPISPDSMPVSIDDPILHCSQDLSVQLGHTAGIFGARTVVESFINFQ